jgi:cbb3-type cytochrome c oxidase subunit III
LLLIFTMLNNYKYATINLLILLGLLFYACAPDKKDEPEKIKRLLGDGFGFDNATLIVENLDSTRKYYNDTLGFNFPEKYEKGIYEGTELTSMNFADFTYFSLLASKDSVIGKEKKSLSPVFIKQSIGKSLYTLSTSSADTTKNWLQLQGLKTNSIRVGRISKEIAKGWDWDNGGPQWRALEFDSTSPPLYRPSFLEITDMPYSEIKEEWKPEAWRKYYEKNPNGVVGFKAIRIVVADLEASSDEFKKMGFAVLETKENFVRFKIARHMDLYLTTPKSTDDELNNILKTKGQGIYSICFSIKNLKETQAFFKKKLAANAMQIDTTQKRLTVLNKYAFGVQLEFEEESEEQARLVEIYDYNDTAKMNSSSVIYASNLYTKYCALCHGKDREGYAADNAPSLRTHALLATTIKPQASYNFMVHTISYGRTGTAMGPYAKKQGGPLDRNDIDLLLRWLREAAGVRKPVELNLDPINGNADLGKKLYARNCSACHGKNGEGISGPVLANPMLLATASDAFLHYTITEGRLGTPMPSFKDSLSKTEINAITAYLRSRASGWNAPAPITVAEPLPKDYVLNPDGKRPVFNLREGKYVPAKQLLQAIKDSAKMILLDARSTAGWQQSHIPGAVSVPYYKEPDKFIKDIPNDNTMIVVYCACPHAASTAVVNTLKRYGYKHTAILDEGILVWTQLGYPVQYGKVEKKKK